MNGWGIEWEREIRRQLEKELGDTFTDRGWRLFRRLGSPEHFRDGGIDWDELKGLAQEFLGMQQELREATPHERDVLTEVLGRRKGDFAESEGQSNCPVEFPELSAEESLRAEVFEEYLARAAANDYYVERFRKQVLRGQLLSVEQFHRLIRSPAAQAFSRHWFRLQQVPILDHDAEMLDYKVGGPEGTSTFDYATVFVRWPDNPSGITETAASYPVRDQRFRMLTFGNEDREAETIPVWRNSVLGELQEIVSQLAKRLPWQEAQGTRYVLTGEPPAVPPVRIRYRLEPARVMYRFVEPVDFNHGAVTFEVAPWVSEKSFRKIHRSYQSRILAGRDNRQPETRSLTLLRFVIARENPLRLTRSRRRKVGKQLVEAWDRYYPHWAYTKYKQPSSAFWKDYDRAERLVMHPTLVSPRALGDWKISEGDGRVAAVGQQ